jgi:DNA-binding protein Alba
MLCSSQMAIKGSQGQQTRTNNVNEGDAASMQAQRNDTVEKRQQERPSRTSPPNHIFVGKKPVMSYAMSAMVQLAQSGEIVLKARGMVISRAVDVAEIVTKRLGNNNFEVRNIRIDTERLGEGDDIRNVSTIEIVVAKRSA